MNNVVDRVPTQVLDNGAVRWEQFDAQGNSLGYVYMKRADEPSVEGTPINKVLFDSIQTDLTNLSTNKLNVSAKATQVEAETGTDDTKYMTPQKTKAQIDVFKGVTYTGVNLSTSQNTTINLSTYMTNKVRRIDIVINAMFNGNPNIVMNGSHIRVGYGGKDGYGSSSVNLGDHTFGYAVAVLSIYLDSNTYSFIGQGAGDTISDKFNVYEFGTFESLTSIVFGAKYDSGNFDNQVAVYQYLK